MNQELNCCTNVCEVPINQDFWDQKYKSHQKGWDLGQVSPPLKSFFDTISNKNSRILIPGCGNAYEAEYLLNEGFTNITLIDISPTLVKDLNSKFKNNNNIQIILGDFFEHKNQYDLIIEQTFFCALPPFLRPKYVWKMHQLLAPKGKLVGLLFNRDFVESPPFGGNKEEYEQLFQNAFEIKKLDVAQNSIPARAQSELIFECVKNEFAKVNLYHFKGLFCMNCVKTISDKFLTIEGIQQISVSSDFQNVLIVSNKLIPISEFESQLAYNTDYSISLIETNESSM